MAKLHRMDSAAKNQEFPEHIDSLSRLKKIAPDQGDQRVFKWGKKQ
jgi:hypothetical protein